MKVILSEDEQVLAEAIVTARAAYNRIVKDGAQAHGASASLLPVSGAGAEVAFWKLTGYQSRINAVILIPDLKDIDGDAVWYGSHYEVRGTDYSSGSLIVHPADNAEAYFVLCLTRHPEYVFPGFILGAEAKSAQYEEPSRANGGRDRVAGNFWVPQHALTPWVSSSG